MSTPEDEIKIDLDAPVEPAVKPEKAAVKEPVVAAEPAGDLEEGLANLQKQLESERSLRIAAERDAAESRQLEANARVQSHSDKMGLLNTALENVKATAVTLKAEYAAALAASEFDKAAEIQEAMSENSSRKVQLESGKTILERQGKPQPRLPSDPVEAFVSTMTPKSADWVRANPQFARDPKLTKKMIRAHEDALEEGISADTPEYFKFVERTLGVNKEPIKVLDDTKNDEPTSEAAAPRRAAPPAAPASRSGNGTGDRRNTMTLTRDEVEAAQISGLTPEEYARNKAAIAKQKQH